MKVIAFFCILVMLTIAQAQSSVCEGLVNYKVDVALNWSKATDSEYDANNSRIGAIIVVVHTKNYTLFEIGKNLTEEARALVEKNNVAPLLKSLNSSDQVHSVGHITGVRKNGTLNFTVQSNSTMNATHVSLIGALMKTPDHFFGVDSVDLCATTKSGTQSLPVNAEVMSYDAGYDARPNIKANATVIPEIRGVTQDNRTTLDHYATYNITRVNEPVCFPGNALVMTESGVQKRMQDLVVGDRVAVGGGKYSDVFMFTHKLNDVAHQFVQIKTEAGPVIRLTKGHYLPLNGAYLPAGEAKLGDRVILADDSTSTVTEVSTVSDIGLFNPQTTQGNIVVDGVRASTYTTAVERNMAHALLAPFRFAFNSIRIRATFLEAGADTFASIPYLPLMA